jgi:4-amino-4-deoxy-L-arabinose transferase-like glycosyltransferase
MTTILYHSLLDSPIKRKLGLVLLYLVLLLALSVSPWSVVRYGAAFLVLWVLPGLAWAALIPGHALDRLEWVIVGLGLGFVVTPTTILLSSYIPGPLTQMQLQMAMAGAVGIPLALSVFITEVRPASSDVQATCRVEERSRARSDLGVSWSNRWAWLLIVMSVAVGLRVTNLNYSEFQGDEAIAIVRAARALEGDEAVIFTHKKGPTELLLVMGSWRLTGMLNEWMARLPFAWANMIGLLAVFLYCRRLKPRHLGAIAAGLLAIEGYLVAFGRIVQYQSVVFALGALGLLCLFVYYLEGHHSLIIVGAALLAGASLAHYDAVLVLPAGLLLIGARLWADRQHIRQVLLPLLFAAFVSLAVIGSFYLPFFQTLQVQRTSSYLAKRVGTGFHNNLPATYTLSAVYDSIYYLVLMLLGLSVTTLMTWARWGSIGWIMGGILLAVTVSGIVWPEQLLAGQTALIWIPSAILCLGALLAPNQSMGTRSVWVWFGVPALFYLFFVAIPRTHVHTFFAAWAILAAMGVIEVGRRLAEQPRAVRWTAYALALVLCTLCIYYPIMMFVDHTPEYRRTFPESRQPIYWTPYDEIPSRGLFGFPYRAGWKVVGYLSDRELLGDHYSSNEEPPVTDYYSRQSVRWNCRSPDVYITAVNVQDEFPVRWDQIESEYQPAHVVTIEGQPKLVIHRRDTSTSPETVPVEDYARLFDQHTTPDKYAWPAPNVDAVLVGDPEAMGATVGSFARLVGYHIGTDQAFPGGFVDLTLVWEGMAPAARNYKVFTHLENREAIWGQMDSHPVCGQRPTTGWQPSEIILDPYRISVADDTPTGSVPVVVGMYDEETLERPPVSAADGVLIGDSIYLGDVLIREK